MKGMVFTEFLEMVESDFGIEVVDKITQNPKLQSHGSYTSVGNYPHGELLLMIGDLSTEVGLAPKDLVVSFGKYLFSSFVVSYPSFFENQSDPLKFLEGIEKVIHKEVRKIYPEARLPEFDCEFVDEDLLQMKYKSERPMADLAEGLILQALVHFGQGGRLERIDGESPTLTDSTFHVYRK